MEARIQVALTVSSRPSPVLTIQYSQDLLVTLITTEVWKEGLSSAGKYVQRVKEDLGMVSRRRHPQGLCSWLKMKPGKKCVRGRTGEVPPAPLLLGSHVHPVCLGLAAEFQSKSQFPPTSAELLPGICQHRAPGILCFGRTKACASWQGKFEQPFLHPPCHALCLGCLLTVTAELIWRYRILVA